MIEWIFAQQGVIIYLALAAGLLGGAIGLPIPEDLPLLAAGIVVHAGAAELLPIFLLCYAAIIAGDMAIFFIGRKLGPAIFNHKWFKARISASRIRKIKFHLERRSLLMIFIARHLFYLRTVTFLACGAVHMSVRRFFLADAAAALISVPLMMAIGYLAAEHYQAALKAIHKIEFLSLVVILGSVVFLVYRALKRKRQKAAAEIANQNLGKAN